MKFKRKTKDDTPSVNSLLSLSLSSAPSPPPPSPSPSPSPSLTSTSNPQLTPFSSNYITPNTLEWPTNNSNHVPNYVDMSSISHWSSSSNQTKNLTKPDFHLGLYPNLSETHLNLNPFFHYDSDKNQNENKIHSILRLDSEKTHEPNRVNSIVPLLSSSAQWYHNRISSGLNRVENNETNRSKFSGLTLNQNMLKPIIKNDLVQVEPIKGKMILVQPTSKDKLEEPDEPVEIKQNQLDLNRKGKLKVLVQSSLKAKGSGEINNAIGKGEGGRVGSGEKKKEEEVEVERSDKDEEPIVEILKSWNLRPRKLVTELKAKVNIGSSRMAVASARVSKPRSAKSRARPSLERPMVKEKQNFEITLTKEEIEHDFTKMTGEKPHKKPFRRPKIIQKNLDVLFPGMYLTNVTPEKYKVNENTPPLKC